MERYRDLHKWMIIVMVIMQLGVFWDYWGDFTENAWSIHVHYAVATLWYVYLILQPYYATRGHMVRHRTNGVIGMFLAGGVGVTALSMMHRDIRLANLARENPERFGPFEPWFFYGICVVEIVMISAFMYAVVQSIIHRRELIHHASWLIATVFIIMMPALARGMQALWFAVGGFESTPVMPLMYASNVVIIALALWTAKRYGSVKHPSTYVVVAVNVFNCCLEPLGRSSPVQAVLEAVIRG